MNRTPLLLLLAAIGTTLTSSSALAWESVTQDRIRNFPSVPIQAIDVAAFVRPGQRGFFMQFVKDGIGGRSYEQDAQNGKLLTCARPFLAGGDIAASDADCRISGEINRAKWGWSEIRKSGEAVRHSEHTLIARASADRAGLMATKLFDVFWLRYPSKNEYIASPIDVDGTTGLPVPGTNFLVGQSYLPTGGVPNGTHVTRSVSLLELPQLADLSNSLADWAAGNELCPLNGYEEAYAGENNDGCHAFRQAMGAVNVTHFKPLNRAVWLHYHRLALAKMEQCVALNTALTDAFTVNWTFRYGMDDIKPYSDHYTEAHECEREAMAYEMFGQHFLQDAWSSGHMWNRWGYESLADYDYALEGEDRTKIPDGNRAARRAGVAGVVAIVGGMVHGAKSVVQQQLAQLNRGLSQRQLVDDPLNGPIWFEDAQGRQPRPVLWSTGEQQYQGAGDDFWAPAQSFAGTVSVSPQFADQRDRLLDCGAKSMLEVYQAGPKLFGEPGPVENPRIGEIDLNSGYCWEQSATNASMRAALGLHNGMYTGTSLVARGATMFTGVIIERYSAALNFPPGAESTYDDEPSKVRVRDRVAFQARLSNLTKTRIMQLKEIYAANALVSPNGTHSSRGCRTTADCPPLGEPLSAAQRIELLRVPPVRPPKLDEPLTQVPYVDKLPSSVTAPDSLLENAVPRMFWRSNLDHTCRESLRNDSQLLNDLRDACLNGADGPGDPAACTECTHRAEALIPVCDSPQRPSVQPSRCSALGVVNNATPPPGLPRYWFVNAERWNPPAEAREITTTNLCAPPFYVAMSWCTGTVMHFKQAHESMSAEVAPMDVDNSVMCPDGTGHQVERIFGTRHFRRSTIVVEPAERVTLKDEDGNWLPWSEYLPGPWLPPMINAYYEAKTYEAGSNACDSATDLQSYSTDSLLQQNIGSANIDEFRDFYFPSPRMPWCGHLQRVSQWGGADADCISASAQVGYSRRLADTVFFDTGEFFSEGQGGQGKTCVIVEPRRFDRSCSDAASTCNAGWQCSANSALPTVRTISTPDPPAPPQ